MLVGIETGGTKVVCAAAKTPTQPLLVETIATTTPEQTLSTIADFVRRQEQTAPVRAVGYGAFGPIDVNPASPTYGTLGATPKPGWAGADLLSPIREVSDAALVVETDVTAAAIGEDTWGVGREADDLAYVTVGTGIGLGAVVAGRPLHGTAHPEAGHIIVRRHPDDDFEGICPLHGDCLEGMASGPALEQRWGAPAQDAGTFLPSLVRMEASYLAQLVVAVSYTLSPAHLVLGGGVMKTPGLLAEVRKQSAILVNGSVAHPVTDATSDYLSAPSLGDRAGVIGALTLAQQADG